MNDGLRQPWDNLAYKALRENDTTTFKNLMSERTHIDLSNCYLRGANLQNVEIKKLIIRGAYLKNADLRGLDLRNNDIEGISINGARISGVYFPDDYSASEIKLSLQHGTRLRKGC